MKVGGRNVVLDVVLGRLLWVEVEIRCGWWWLRDLVLIFILSLNVIYDLVFCKEGKLCFLFNFYLNGIKYRVEYSVNSS